MENRRFLSILSEQKILLVIIALGVFLAVRSPYFLTYYNIVNIFSFISIEGVIVIGMTLLIILGEIDLSVGATMALSCIVAIMMQRWGVLAGVLSGLVCGMGVGLVNGFLVTKFRLSSIPVTLGMMVFLNGLVLALTNGQSVKGDNAAFMKIAQPVAFSISGSVIIFVLLIVIFQIVLRRTVFGRNIYAVGGNITASKFFGINVNRIRVICFVITGFFAGLAGVLLASKINVASARLGVNSALLVITAVLLGGVSLSGGEGSIYKAFQGLLLIGVLNNAMVLLQLSSFIQDMTRGAVLIIILIVDAMYVTRAKFR
ncbi:MAG: ABC transporter permease [Spirochaetales bacterium]|nr:MAG: ABC transporter permease [Spirochaetales bacterium]